MDINLDSSCSFGHVLLWKTIGYPLYIALILMVLGS